MDCCGQHGSKDGSAHGGHGISTSYIIAGIAVIVVVIYLLKYLL